MIFFTDKTMTVISNGSTEFVDLETELGKECLDLYRRGKLDEIPTIIEQSKLIGNGVEEGRDGSIVVEGVSMDARLASKLREFKSKGLPYDYLKKLAQRIDSIEDFHVRTQLYGFLQHNGHPITKDGTFIAYKKVRQDYRDIHSGKYDNNVGNLIEMARRDVDSNPQNTCSSGLHVAAFDYAKDFGSGRLVLCEVAPEDVVAVPNDYNQMKMRTCKYKVVGETEESIEAVRYGGDCIFDIDDQDEISLHGEGFLVESVTYIDDGVVVDLRSKETGTMAHVDYDITEETFYFI